MTRLFISYSRKDVAFAQRLAAALESLGADVWIDRDDIPAGMKWSSAIQQGLNISSVMLVIISPDSMASRNVEDEWQFYLDHNKPVLPILLRPAEVHFQLSRIQYVDFYNQPYDTAFQQLYGELRRKGIELKPQTGFSTSVSIPVQSPLPARPDSLPTSHSPVPRPVPPQSPPPPSRRTVSIGALAVGLVLVLRLGAAGVAALMAMNPPIMRETPILPATRTPFESDDSTSIAQAATATPFVLPSLTPTVYVPPTDPPLPTPFGGGGRVVFVSSRNSGAWALFQINADGGVEIALPIYAANPRAPAWSPDGTRIAFEAGADGSRDIYVAQINGGTPQQLTFESGDDRAPAWSPDGTRIAYQSMQDGNREIYVMNADGGNKQRLTNHPATDALPSWSPDGRQIAFASDRWRGENNGDIAIMSAFDGNGVTQLTNAGNNLSPAWSPDGNTIAYVSAGGGDRNINLLDIASRGIRSLVAASGVNEDYPSWSPDGQHIIFTNGAQIAISNLSGQIVRTLTNSAGNNYWPRWSSR
jgi:Tol biopolymer transport system component